MPQISSTPEPPYYSVIFVANPSDDLRDYPETVGRMVELAAGMPGFLGIEYAHEADGGEIVVSYWRDEASIAGWKQHAEHLAAQQRGRDQWYSSFVIRIARVERDYGFSRS